MVGRSGTSLGQCTVSVTVTAAATTRESAEASAQWGSVTRSIFQMNHFCLIDISNFILQPNNSSARARAPGAQLAVARTLAVRSKSRKDQKIAPPAHRGGRAHRHQQHR